MNTNTQSTTEENCGKCLHSKNIHCHIEPANVNGELPITGACKTEGCDCEMLQPEVEL